MIYNSASPQTKFRASPFCSQGGKLETCGSVIVFQFHKAFFRLYFDAKFLRVGGSRSKERDQKSELVLRSTYQIFEWDRNNSHRNFYNVVRYVHIPLVP